MVEALIEVIIGVILLSILLAYIARSIYNNRIGQILFVLIFSSITTFIVVFYGDLMPIRLPNKVVLDIIDEITSQNRKKDTKDINTFIRDNFLLINISEEDNKNTKVTTRAQMADFLRELNQLDTSLFQFVTINAYFDTTSKKDDLYEQLNSLYQKNKLLLAYEPNKSKDPIIYQEFWDVLGQTIYKEEESKYMYEQYSRKIPLGGYPKEIPSLSYKLYQKMNEKLAIKINFKHYNFFNIYRETSNDECNFLSNPFFPLLFQSTEEWIDLQNAKHDNRAGDNITMTREEAHITYNAERKYQNINEFDPTQLYIDHLKGGNSNRTIIFVGNYQDEHKDVHETAFGKFHGSMILLNNIYHFNNKNHKITFGYITTVFISMLIIYSLLVGKSFSSKKVKKHNRDYISHANIRIVLKTAKQIFLVEFHYVLLLLLFVLSYFCFDKIINILFLTSAFILIETLLEQTNNYYNSND